MATRARPRATGAGPGASPLYGAGGGHDRCVRRARVAGDGGPGHRSRPRRPSEHRVPHLLRRLRRHRRQPPRRQPPAPDGHRPSAAGRSPSDRAPGRRHHPRGRPQRQGRRASRPGRGADPGQRRGHPGPGRAHRRHRGRPGRQRRVAGPTAPDRLPARRRRPLPGQRHDGQGLGAGPPRARPGDLLQGVLLHAPPGLRLLAPVRPTGTAGSRSGAATSGATSPPGSTSSTAGSGCRPTGSRFPWSRGRTGRSSARARAATSGSIRPAPAPTSSSSSGCGWATPTSAATCACSPGSTASASTSWRRRWPSTPSGGRRSGCWPGR